MMHDLALMRMMESIDDLHGDEHGAFQGECAFGSQRSTQVAAFDIFHRHLPLPFVNVVNSGNIRMLRRGAFFDLPEIGSMVFEARIDLLHGNDAA